MKSRILFFGFLWLVPVLQACQNTSDSAQIDQELIGKWKLDSVNLINRKFSKITFEGKILELKGFNKFHLSSWNSDVMTENSGNYFILSNPRRNCKSIVLIPDLRFADKDTIRSYINYDILSITNDRLLLVGETQFLYPSVRRSIVFNEQYIFHRSK